MSEIKHTTDKKRKRRSFWEPESAKVAAWLDAQTDLGTSLQLVIVDAIRKYGDGDAIKAHLSHREEAAFDWERSQERPVERVERVQPEPTPLVQETVVIPVQKPVTPPVVAKETQPEPEPESEPEPELTLDFNQDFDELEEPDAPESEQNDEEFDVANMIDSAKEANVQAPLEEEDDNEEFDPIAIMMRDSGSKLDK